MISPFPGPTPRDGPRLRCYIYSNRLVAILWQPSGCVKLARARAISRTHSTRGAWLALEGDIPAACVHDLRQELPALTRGEGVLECAFDRYEPVTGVAPTRPRLGANPLNREEYLQQVTRRTT